MFEHPTPAIAEVVDTIVVLVVVDEVVVVVTGTVVVDVDGDVVVVVWHFGCSGLRAHRSSIVSASADNARLKTTHTMAIINRNIMAMAIAYLLIVPSFSFSVSSPHQHRRTLLNRSLCVCRQVGAQAGTLSTAVVVHRDSFSFLHELSSPHNQLVGLSPIHP